MSLIPPADSEVWSVTATFQRLSTMVRNAVKVSTTDAPIALTPRQAIWTLNKATLYRYTPQVPPEQRHPVPLLLIFALMNRSSILDLRPGNSFVEFALQRGYDVYLIDWGAPGPEDADLGLEDYVLEYIPRAIRKMKSVSGSDTFSVLGWCIGALLSTLYASLRPDDGLKNLILLTAPLDFTDKDKIELSTMTDERNFNVDRVLAAHGNMPAELIDYGAKMLKPIENFFGSWLRLLDNLDNTRVVDSWHAMSTWVNDGIPMAARTYRQLIVDFYRENRLMKGTLSLRGEKVDVANLKANLLDVIAEDDHITPPCQSETVVEKIGSADKQVLRVPGGHIGIMAGSGAAKSTWPKIDAWLSERSSDS
ncbi:MAG TPA: alpha/beta fold hydrolase [Myxococcales bacterium]|nr:alpha/beta fold hydrolase [Myxococcales bacterium]